MCENVRFSVGEKADDEALSKQMAVCDVYVMDAFGTAHRPKPQLTALANSPIACSGPLLSAELAALEQALATPARPMMAIVGGSKVSTKLTVLDALSKQVDQLIVGGGIANTFIAAAGHNVGKSLYEPDLVDEARRLVEAAQAKGGDIPVPTDVVVAKALDTDAEATIKSVSDVADDTLILDIGPETAKVLGTMLEGAGTVVWNGLSACLNSSSLLPTRALGEAIARSSSFSIAGTRYWLRSTPSGSPAMCLTSAPAAARSFELIEGKTLPAVAMLEARGA